MTKIGQQKFFRMKHNFFGKVRNISADSKNCL